MSSPKGRPPAGTPPRAGHSAPSVPSAPPAPEDAKGAPVEATPPPKAPAAVSVPLDAVKRDAEVIAFIEKANEYTGAIGYTEHGARHANLVGNIAYNILRRLGKDEREAQLAAIAGYLHDIGNLVGRMSHQYTGAVLAARTLARLGMDPTEQAIVMGAIGNHEEPHGEPVSSVGAAVILSDKSDVHRSRVRNPDPTTFDIHDRVNYAVEHSFLRVDEKNKTITLELTIDTELSQVMEYFEIFLSRMVMCRRAAAFLGCSFKLQINGVKLL
jgi:metal-dependent HD superfamily phosphatase/phosphodiesterase